MTFRTCALALLCSAFCLTANATGSDSGDKKTRVGTCADARSQMEYFCDDKNKKSDSMVQMGTACNNAKNNVKEACEGVVEPDKKYEFKKE